MVAIEIFNRRAASPDKLNSVALAGIVVMADLSKEANCVVLS
jgi:hypothetical protein